jgi:predicted DNA-binding transcriptional regulator YafY
MTTKSIARALDVSRRTVFRDLNALELAGVPYHYDAIDGYRITGDFFLPPVQLTLGEAMALSVLTSQMARRRQIPFLEDAFRAAMKVQAQLPAPIREEVAADDTHVRVEGPRVSPQENSGRHFESLRKAIAAKRKVRCTYDGGNHGRMPFLFRPYVLFFGQRAWYVVGYSELAGAERTLKLNRIGVLEPTDRPYMIPNGWTLERSLGNAWRMIRGRVGYHVKIRFDREHGRNVADTLWHPTQRITWCPDESECIFECDVDGLDEIVWWVLGYGSHARVLEPRELVSRVSEMAQQMSRQYSSKVAIRGRSKLATVS